MCGLSRIFFIVSLVVSLFTISACSWMGETAGRAKAGIENSIHNTKDGYDKGYKQGKSPSGEQTTQPATDKNANQQPASSDKTTGATAKTADTTATPKGK